VSSGTFLAFLTCGNHFDSFGTLQLLSLGFGHVLGMYFVCSLHRAGIFWEPRKATKCEYRQYRAALRLCSRANHLQQDRNGLTPVDYLKSCEGFPDASCPIFKHTKNMHSQDGILNLVDEAGHLLPYQCGPLLLTEAAFL